MHEHDARLIHPREHANRRLSRGRERAAAPAPGLGHRAAQIARPGCRPRAGGGDARRRRPRRPAADEGRPPLPWLWEDLARRWRSIACPASSTSKTPARREKSRTATYGVREIALAHPELPMILSQLFGGLGVHPPSFRSSGARRTSTWISPASSNSGARSPSSRARARPLLHGPPFADPGIYISNVQNPGWTKRRSSRSPATIAPAAEGGPMSEILKNWIAGLGLPGHPGH